MKPCKKCKEIKSASEFYPSTCEKYLSPCCKPCHIQNNKEYTNKNKALQLNRMALCRARKYNRVPPWIDNANNFNKLYEKSVKLSESGINYEVDHIIPLKHPLVSGLHVPWNMHIITDAENIVKLDTWDGTRD